ncbi:uncharacterized protein LOC127250123 [Andrographis paniculata]|uniref:uncharacterized protein LOC127250123 n=1 Tax=Andrographis paniculata TaxID=175694 RepID=UPI0021E95DCA|nr:uncharacterized protein LOC127250123 [Andrographis paniculata]
MASSTEFLLHAFPTLPSSTKFRSLSLSLSLHPTTSILSPPQQIKSKSALNKPPRRKFVVRISDGSPEAVGAAGDLLASFSLPLPGGFSLSDNPWIAGIAGLAVAVPLLIQRLLTLTKQIDMAAGAVEKIADAVGKVAEHVDEVAEDLSESLPEGGLKKMVGIVEEFAEKTHEGAEKVEDLMEKVDELTDRVDEFVTMSKPKSNTTDITEKA